MRVLILDNFCEIYADRLAALFPALDLLTARSLDDLPDGFESAEVLIAFGVAIDNDLVRRMTRLRWIQSLATGVDHFVNCPFLKGTTVLTSMRGIHGPEMREMVLYMMLSLGHDGGRVVRDQMAHRWERRPRRLLWRKTAAVLGTGISGAAIGGALQALEMHTIGLTRAPRAVPGFDETIHTDRLVEVARDADFLINVLPGSPENRDLIGHEVFAAMKPTARFVNVGRGETVDEAALLEALTSGRIAGAALDVFRSEPLPSGSPFWDLPNVFITPHIAGFCREYEDQALGIVIDNMRQFLAGGAEKMRNVVPH